MSIEPTHRRPQSSFSTMLNCFRVSASANSEAFRGRPDSFARQLIGAWSGLLCVCIHLLSVVRNIAVKGVSPEAGFDMFGIAFMVVALLLLCRFQRTKAAFRLGILTAIFMGAYTVAFNVSVQEDALIVFFIIPSCTVFLLGFRESLFWLTPMLMGLTGYCIFPHWVGAPGISTPFCQRYLLGLVLFTGYSSLVQYLSERNLDDLQNANTAIKNATDELKQLKGLVPVCSYCRKILDEKGYWRHLETFLQQHTNASISSGLCETCAARMGKSSTPDDIVMPVSLQSLFGWRNSFEDIRRYFMVYASLVASALLWGFIILDWANGDFAKAWTQIVISMLLMGSVWFQHRAIHLKIGSILLIVIMFVLLVQPFFHSGPILSQLFWSMLFPLVAAFLLKQRLALIFILALFTFILTLLFFPQLFHLPNVTGYTRFFFLLTFISISALSMIMERLRRLYSRRLTEQLQKLEQTFQSIRTIKGLVPVCRECKAIRNDEGFWTSFDNYFRTHTDMVCSHGICESCLEKESPETYEELLAEKKL